MNIDTLMEELDDYGVATEDAIERVGSSEAYLDYLRRFLNNQDLIDLQNAVANHEAVEGEHAVHTLKGTALTLGLLPFADECIDMLTTYRSGNAEEAEAQMDAVLAAFDKLKEMITKVDE